MRFRFTLLPPVVAIALAGCPDPAPDGVLRPGNGVVRVQGPQPECVEEFDCDFVERCEAGICERRPDCEEHSDCRSNLCWDGECSGCDPSFPVLQCPSESLCVDRNCIPPSPDFEYEIKPLLTTTACTACHQVDNLPLPSTLGLDGDLDSIYIQLLDPLQTRINFERPEASTLITKPAREDPPDHPVGVWDPEGPEVTRLLAWIRNGAPRFSPCRVVEVSGALIDCFEVQQPENICADLVVDGSIQSLTVDACINCSARFSTFDADALACLSVDGGVAPDGGDAVDADAGRPDAGGLDAGLGAGVSDAGVPDAG